MYPFGAITDLILALSLGVIITLPYLLDRVLARRLGGWLCTLVFPLAVTTVWYLTALLPQAGTWFNPAYSQYGDLPLMQLVSVTGNSRTARLSVGRALLFVPPQIPVLVNELVKSLA